MKKYADIIIINFITLTVGVCIFYFFDKVEVLAAIIATGISLSLGMRHYKTENDKLFKELFTEFNTKYDDKFNDKLQEIITQSETNENFELTLLDEQLIVDYLNFCSEEYLWKTKGRISNEVWNAWENGMVYYLNNPIINKVVIKQKGQKDSYYGLFSKIEKRVNNL
jgi:hypothetical protein